METLIAYAITFAICAWGVRAEVKEEERKNKMEEEKAKRLKFFLEKCADARKNENLQD
ncbi:MAG: hypothetical protein Q8O93_05315 [bacterium]|nr:hypothetical protein [bacterium]